MKNSKVVLAISLFLAWANLVYAQGDIATGKLKAATCATCHGADGNAEINHDWPKLSGQHSSYFVKQLLDFRLSHKDGRIDPVMTPLAIKLSDQDIQDLAAYYASLKGNIDVAEPATVNLGQKLYRGGDLKKGIPACMACHSPNGFGNGPAAFPDLSGQHANYIEAQLKAFRSGARTNDVNHMMRDIAVRMSDEDIVAVSNYISGLH